MIAQRIEGGLTLKRDTAAEMLPARVRTAIRTQEDQTERLIGWIQLAVMATFAVLYLISPKTDSAHDTFRPVPWVLGLYFLFTGLRLVLAYRISLPGWFLVLSVAIDMGLLFALIWSFHLQYEQPASFYLKAPTLLYVFIFIALRALRFEARFVLTAGLVAAAGWVALVAYVVLVEPDNPMITRNYVEYLTSNSVLLGAEFDKIVSILLVTAILAVAIQRGRRLLVRSVAEGMAARELSRFFAPEVARKIAKADQQVRAGAGEARDAAILNLDLRGFTGLAETLRPDTVMATLGAYQARMLPIIQRHGGSIDKFLGDGIMATFGAAAPSDSYAADALRAMDALMAESAAWAAERAAAGEPPVPVNGALATGRIVFGAVGDPSRLEYTVIGGAVNLSAKLDKHNKVLGLRAVTTAEAYELALAQGYAPPAPRERLPAQTVDGIGEPLDLVALAR
jgi:adenylate cyclase